MLHHYAFTNTKLNFPLQKKGNETVPTIDWTPLKTNTLTVTNNLGSATVVNTIAVSVGKKI
jgi:hypothetical protein